MSTQTYTDGVTLTAAAEFNNFDSVAYSVLSGVAGTNTITATGPANYTYSSTRPPVYFIPANTNTGATTINITPSGGAALGAKNLFFNGGACTGGELIAGGPVAIIYDGTQFNLLTSARRRPSVQVVTSTGTHSVPSWARRAKVYVKGAGASGGGSSTANSNGGGGGEGEERWGWVNVVPGTTVTVTINAGGVAINANTNSTGNSGGTTVWTDGTSTITANGGLGGTSGNNGGAGGTNGAAGSGGDYAMPGQSGQAGGTAATTAGTAINAAGGGKGAGALAASGTANSGGGGGGGTTAAASGAGAVGICVTEYWP